MSPPEEAQLTTAITAVTHGRITTMDKNELIILLRSWIEKHSKIAKEENENKRKSGEKSGNIPLLYPDISMDALLMQDFIVAMMQSLGYNVPETDNPFLSHNSHLSQRIESILLDFNK